MAKVKRVKLKNMIYVNWNDGGLEIFDYNYFSDIEKVHLNCFEAKELIKVLKELEPEIDAYMAKNKEEEDEE